MATTRRSSAVSVTLGKFNLCRYLRRTQGSSADRPLRPLVCALTKTALRGNNPPPDAPRSTVKPPRHSHAHCPPSLLPNSPAGHRMTLLGQFRSAMITSSKTQLRALRERREAACSASSLGSKAILGGVLLVLLYLLYSATDSWLAAVGILALFAVWTWFLTERHDRWLDSLATSRVGESICDFVRSFPRGSVEPVLLRAVYEGVRVQMGGSPVPIRAADRLTIDLRLDPDDIDEVYWEIADTCGYETEGGEQNPFRSRVETVSDLVYFLQHQPRTA